MEHQVLLFYKYVTVSEPKELADALRALARRLKLTGRILIAEEGINGTVEGTFEATEEFATAVLAYEQFADMSIKRSGGAGDTFPKLAVKVRDEIVGTRFSAEVDPRLQTAPRLSADTLREWYAQGKDFAIVDMRNDYEFASGHFKDSINPGLENSRDLPAAIEKLAPLKDKTVLTVCTGGVRCEKMSAYLLAQGFNDVYQLEDGIHGYMEKYPGQDYLGTLYTFDQRVVMDFGGAREIIGRCHLCTAATERYVNCGNDFCHLHFLACTDCASEDGKTYCSGNCFDLVAKREPEQAAV